MSVLANYQEERAAFWRLFDPDCQQRIVMYQGESGSGKSTLIEACRTLMPPNVRHLAMDLRGSAVPVTEILSRTVLKMGGLAKLPHFSQRVASLSRVPSLNLADNTLKGTQNQIEVVVNNTELEDRQERYVQLTEAWFEDLTQQNQPLLLMLDTFEQANQDVRDWIGGSLLGRAADTKALRILFLVPKLFAWEPGPGSSYFPCAAGQEARASKTAFPIWRLGTSTGQGNFGAVAGRGRRDCRGGKGH